MTHLEDLWAQFPSSKPPTAAIVAAGKGPFGVRPRRVTLFVAAATVAAGAVVATSLISPGKSGPSNSVAVPGTSGSLKYVAFQADLAPASSCDALLTAYQQRAMAKVTPYGWNGGGYYLSGRRYYTPADAPIPMPGVVHGTAMNDLISGQMSLQQSAPQAALGSLNGALVKRSAQSPKLLAQGNSATGTNVQEFGVDEPDSVKTNGTLIARLNGNTLAVYDASGDTVKQRGTIGLPYFGGGTILMSGTTVIASGYDADPAASIKGGTRVDTISLSDPDHPTVTSSVVYAGGSITALRQQGSTVRLIMASGLPQLKFTYPQQGKRTNAQALATNKHLIAMTTLKDWVPTYDSGSGAQQLLPCTNVAVPPAGVPLGTTSIVSFDVSNPTGLNAIGVAGTLGNAYESQHDLYLTVGGNAGGCYAVMCPRFAMGNLRPCCFNGTSDGLTTVLQFKLDSLRTTHVATGQVQGTIQDSWSMDEFNGVLRVVTTRYATNSHVNVIETLVPHGARLVRQGLLTGLGENQTLTAARWFNNVAIVSTTQQIDPLYTIDLSDTAHPRQLGALHLPGDTEYIHPISPTRFLTVSLQRVDRAGSYMQVALFDTTDLAHVKQLAQVSAGGNTSSLAGQDPKTFTWLPDRQTALTSFWAPKGLFLGAYAVHSDHTLTQKLYPLASNDGSARTFEVGNGKVVLVNGGSVAFLTM
ncbi:hypothetical protein Back2_12020 [Nocardioides baekrokdamisoli]|uniref:Beta propeller domain-containing protein n=1 Tax=Nocardioides baekrokdamisoli TaxID=1804624 RepID=A0A3G9ILL1_9ACTN|nr:beta-propeller domain-containing protein [Nocardioides baekrokdamisoli]BBH16915.1 hypothetical protein Back2_12020 [Nocardioides baekrokdamisoli]